jgi:L-alanine-DL-glutamate epimerase-like enolase superfamily enzyme
LKATGESAMRIESLETLHADGGRRAFDFVKLTTDDGLVGWSEYNETFGGAASRR